MRLYFLILLLGCVGKVKGTTIITSVSTVADDSIRLHKLKKLAVAGDFNGDGKKDTIFTHNYSRLTRKEIENSADPFQNEWDTVVKWFHDQDAGLYLTVHETNPDTLHLGSAQGLYCLINIGDNNSDGKDEIAVVVDRLDFSNLNSCEIYSLCSGKWTLLKQFNIHESAFTFTTDQAPVVDQIKNHLRKQNGKWFFREYSPNETEKQAGASGLGRLSILKCK